MAVNMAKNAISSSIVTRAQRDPFCSAPDGMANAHRPTPWRRPFRTPTLTGVMAASLSVAGCGGGGTLASIPTPPPAPSPTPSPAAAVPPFPSASPPTTYNAENVTMGADITVQQLPGDKARVTGITNVKGIQDPNHVGLSLTYEGPDRYTLDYNGFGGPGFLPADVDGSTAEFDSFRKAAKGGYTENLELARKGVGITLTYMTFGNQTTIGPYDNTITFFAAGSFTSAAHMPTSGTANYTGVADGLWVDGGVTRRLYGSPASLTADFATGRVTSILDLRGREVTERIVVAAPTTVLGKFTGTGTIRGAGASGSYAPTGGYSGSFSGGFFGPSAEEYGVAFKLTGGPNQSVLGVAVGKR